MTKNDVKEKAGDWKSQASEAVGTLGNKVRETAEEWQERAAETSRKAAKAADEYVRDNPWPVLGSVAVACFALGFLIGRSRD